MSCLEFKVDFMFRPNTELPKDVHSAILDISQWAQANMVERWLEGRDLDCIDVKPEIRDFLMYCYKRGYNLDFASQTIQQIYHEFIIKVVETEIHTTRPTMH